MSKTTSQIAWSSHSLGSSITRLTPSNSSITNSSMYFVCQATGATRTFFFGLVVLCFAIGTTNAQPVRVGKQIKMYEDRKAITSGISLIESGNDDLAVGDRRSLDGPALGRFQIHQSAWMDIDIIRKANAMTLHPYHKAHDANISEEYAYTLLMAIRASFIKYHSHSPSPIILYACYSLGPSTIPRIKSMRGLELNPIPDDESMWCPQFDRPYYFLTSIGIPYRTAVRKFDTGSRYSALIAAHKLQMASTGIPLLYK